MKRFLATLLLSSILFSHLGVFFQPVYAEVWWEAQEVLSPWEEIIVPEEEEEIISSEADVWSTQEQEEESPEEFSEVEITYWDESGEEVTENVYQDNESENISDISENNIFKEELSIQLINMNTANFEQLVSISWIWKSTAENILSYREETPFCDIEELIHVRWVWPATLKNIKEAWWFVDTDLCLDEEESNSDEIGQNNTSEDWENWNTHPDESSDWNIDNDAEDTSDDNILDDEISTEEILENMLEQNDEWQTEVWDTEEQEAWETWEWNNMDEPLENENEEEKYLENSEQDWIQINLNFASLEELVSIHWVWTTIAQNIIVYREENIFCTLEDLLKVNRVWPSLLSQIEEVWYVAHPDCTSEPEENNENTSNNTNYDTVENNKNTENNIWALWWDTSYSDSEIPFQIIYEFQRPSDLSPIFQSIHAYDCDRGRQDCRVNLDYRASFSSDFPVRNYTCLTDFWFWEITWEEEKCNPNTVTFSLWVHEVFIRVEEKAWEKNIYEQRFTVRNLGYLSAEKRQSLALSSGEKVWKIDITLPRIIAQSGLEAIDGTGKFFRCLKKDCKINLDYSQRHSSERCLWDFWVWVPNHPTTHTRCNPWIVTFPEWDHELSLTVYENRFESNSRTFIFFVNNIWINESINNDKNDILKNNKNIKNSIIDIWNIQILLQWRIWKEKIYDSENQELRCVGVEKCSINLIWEIEHSKRWLNYIWYVNNEVFFENINPPAEWFDSWEYEIILEIYNEEEFLWSSVFFVKVEWKENLWNSKNKKQENIEPWLFDTLIHDGIIIYDFLADPIGSDMKEFIELRNTTSEARDLYGCYLEDKAKRKYRFKLGEYIWAYEQRRLFRPQTKLTLWNQSGRIALICNSEEIQNITWETKAREWISYLWKYVEVFQPEYIRSELSGELYENYVKNVFSFSTRALKYDGLRVRGETLPHSRLEWYMRGQRFFSLETWASGRYVFDTKNIGTWKHEVQFILTDIFWTNYELKTRTFTLKPDAKAFWNTSRPGSTPRVPTLRIISQAHAETPWELLNNSDIVLRRFFLLWAILFIILVASWHLFFLAFPPSMALRELQIQTRVRTELIFLLPSQ